MPKKTIRYRSAVCNGREMEIRWENGVNFLFSVVLCQTGTTPFWVKTNATMRERLAVLTRKCRHAAHRLDALHNWMYLHPSSQRGVTHGRIWPINRSIQAQ